MKNTLKRLKNQPKLQKKQQIRLSMVDRVKNSCYPNVLFSRDIYEINKIDHNNSIVRKVFQEVHKASKTEMKSIVYIHANKGVLYHRHAFHLSIDDKILKEDTWCSKHVKIKPNGYFVHNCTTAEAHRELNRAATIPFYFRVKRKNNHLEQRKSVVKNRQDWHASKTCAIKNKKDGRMIERLITINSYINSSIKELKIHKKIKGKIYNLMFNTIRGWKKQKIKITKKLFKELALRIIKEVDICELPMEIFTNFDNFLRKAIEKRYEGRNVTRYKVPLNPFPVIESRFMPKRKFFRPTSSYEDKWESKTEAFFNKNIKGKSPEYIREYERKSLETPDGVYIRLNE